VGRDDQYHSARRMSKCKHDQSSQEHTCKLYPIANISHTTQPWKLYDSYALGSLCNAQLMHCQVRLPWERGLRGCLFCRCLVPGCDDPANASYFSPFLLEAIPPADHDEAQHYRPHQCQMYMPYSNATNLSCPLGHFSRHTVTCDAWVYEDNEHTIVGEVGVSQVATQPNLASGARTKILESPPLSYSTYFSCVTGK
jgi:hypothetical protein